MVLVAPCHVGSVFPDQGLNLCTLCWQLVSQPADHQSRPIFHFCVVTILMAILPVTPGDLLSRCSKGCKCHTCLRHLKLDCVGHLI